MKNSFYNNIAITTLILSIFGLSTIPFLAVILQYIDSITGFSPGRGYYSESYRYIFKSPLIYILITFCIYIIISITFLIISKKNSKK